MRYNFLSVFDVELGSNLVTDAVILEIFRTVFPKVRFHLSYVVDAVSEFFSPLKYIDFDFRKCSN